MTTEKLLEEFNKYQDEYQALINEDDSNLDLTGDENYSGRRENLEKQAAVVVKIREIKSKLDSATLKTEIDAVVLEETEGHQPN